ncbi:MAG: dihydrofolate reductase family protein [Enterobacteriaceae bacterium]
MSKLIYYVAGSLDGYIATTDHQLDWLEQFDLGEDATPYEAFYQNIGAVIMGGKTYRWIMDNTAGNWPYPTAPAFIHTLTEHDIPEGLEIYFRQDSPTEIATEARKVAQGKDIWLVGGGETATRFALAGELQQLWLTTIPVILGSGIKLFPAGPTFTLIPRQQRFLRSGASECLFDIRVEENITPPALPPSA